MTQHCSFVEQTLNSERTEQRSQELQEHLKTCVACQAALEVETYLLTLRAETEERAVPLPAASVLLVKSRVARHDGALRDRFRASMLLIHAAMLALGAGVVVLATPLRDLETWESILEKSNQFVVSVPPEALVLVGVLATAVVLLFSLVERISSFTK